ncbi:hypothetical protein CAEBREN_19777 [Caenorhabditis brenneri]|uniref:Uncharacterized protein n=1 Tax=Caenorhabditis brenneri TaxID=135651 RepID=G0PCV6_CAEBE|nr:hypothetical protein CAEBREN_19777 [Caenorhabditis brenneri]
MATRESRPKTPRDESNDDDHVPMSYRSMPEHFFIVHFLGDILSEETKRELRVLHISGYGTFEDKWMEAVSCMFPKLEELNIKGRQFSEDDFAISCNNLPNLHTLRIGHSSFVNLNGISKLKNLSNLAIDNSFFRNKKDVGELFKLKHLKTLSLSHNSNADWNYDFYFAKRFPVLTRLEIGWARADDDFLKRILPKLPKLQVLVANDTEIHAAPPSVTVYTSRDLKTIMESLAYFRITGNRGEIFKAIQKFWEIYRDWNVRRTCTPDQLTVCVNEVEALLETFKFDKELVKSVNSCVDVFACFAMGDGHLNVNKLKIVSVLLKNLKNHLKIRTSPDKSIFKSIWLDVSRFIQNTENLNIDEIASLAMESIIHGGGALYWEQFCAELLEKILDRMDLSSEFYKKINFRKLHECLSIIHKRTELFAERRARAGDVLEYIELFM